MLTRCPHCSHEINVPDDYLGKHGKCPKCGEAFVITNGDLDNVPQSPQESKTSIATLLIVALSAAAIAGAIGFGGGMLLTRPQRSDLQSKIDNAVKPLQSEIASLKKQNQKLSTKLTRAKKTITGKQFQQESDLQNIMPQRRSIDIPGVVSQEVFGIRLGESIRSLRGRLKVQESSYSFKDKDHPGEIWDVEFFNPEVKELTISTYDDRVYQISVYFKDASEINYNVIHGQLIQKYNTNHDTDNLHIFGNKADFQANINGVKVQIALTRDIGIGEADKLNLEYAYPLLAKKMLEELERRKAANINIDL